MKKNAPYINPVPLGSKKWAGEGLMECSHPFKLFIHVQGEGNKCSEADKLSANIAILEITK
jgi:hypothetical protein